jgi:tRNA threonylcarbamoyladenosine biosynthesis protein TsaE
MRSKKTKRFRTFSSAETKKLGFEFAKQLLREPILKNARVIALQGTLGGGKTTFVQGVMRGFGLRARVTSPTFVLIKRFPLHRKKIQNIYHLDCYRLKNERALRALHIDEAFRDPHNLLFIEWAEKVRRILPPTTIWITFTHTRDEHERVIDFSSI